jgi:hypothetical protein
VLPVLETIASCQGVEPGESGEAAPEITHTIIRRSGMRSYKPTSRGVSRESLGDWAHRDGLARHALYAGMTEAELIHRLLEDRQALKKRLAAALFTSPPPVVISEAAFKRLQARKGEPPAAIDESDCFDCGLSQEEARDELQRIERLL